MKSYIILILCDFLKQRKWYRGKKGASGKWFKESVGSS